MIERHDIVDRALETLKEPVQIDPSLDDRVMARIADLPAPARAPIAQRIIEWLTRRRTLRLSPIGGLAMAAGIVAIVTIGNRLVAPAPSPTGVAQSAEATTTMIQFVLVAPNADSVTVVGDFNDWNVSATPLQQRQSPGVWSVTVPLAPGRYQYSFLIDGTTWVRDPRGAPSVEDEFGSPNSVVTVGGA